MYSLVLGDAIHVAREGHGPRGGGVAEVYYFDSIIHETLALSWALGGVELAPVSLYWCHYSPWVFSVVYEVRTED